MKNSFFSIAVIASAFSLMGAGCFGGGSSSQSSSGGIWLSTNAGKAWEQRAAVPTATGVDSLANVNVTMFAADPQDSETLYAGTAENGMFFSLDAGVSWQRPENTLARSGKILTVAVSAKDVCTVFVAKPDRVMKSTDCMRSFETDSYVESQAETVITALALDWYDPSIVWIGTSAGNVIRSVDGGESWTTITRVDDDITAIAISNADSRVVLVGTNTTGMSRSTDGGATWTNFEKTLKEYKSSDRVYGFAQNASGDMLVMNTKFGLLSSKDSGATWNPIALISGSGDVRIYSVALAPNSSETLYYATQTTLHRSTDAGSAWTTSALPSSRAGAALLVSAEDETVLFLGSATVSTK